MREYIALFCPRCNAHINELDLEADLFVQSHSSAGFTCGWCHTRQHDYRHIKTCRSLTRTRMILGLRRLEAQLTEEINADNG